MENISNGDKDECGKSNVFNGFINVLGKVRDSTAPVAERRDSNGGNKARKPAERGVEEPEPQRCIIGSPAGLCGDFLVTFQWAVDTQVIGSPGQIYKWLA